VTPVPTALVTLAQVTEQLPQQAATGGAAEFWVFWILAPLSLGAALSVLLLRNPVHAALMLVVNFFTIAVFYAVLEAQFLAVVQVIVYAGAVMVLFLLMLLGVAREDDRPDRMAGAAFQRVLAITLGVVLFGALTIAVAGPWMGAGSACGEPPAPNPVTGAPLGPLDGACIGLAEANADGNVRALGGLVFTDYVWPFEVTSVLLVIAALGAMVLGRRDEKAEDLVDGGSPEAHDTRLRARPVAAPLTVGAGARTAAAEDPSDVAAGPASDRPDPTTVDSPIDGSGEDSEDQR
jgi:NADH-quinone oxidoreductase subunit J